MGKGKSRLNGKGGGAVKEPGKVDFYLGGRESGMPKWTKKERGREEKGEGRRNERMRGPCLSDNTYHQKKVREKGENRKKVYEEISQPCR